ncbi:unnamed protein product [Ceratitis capitata]|uniref:(Mediterranean fruit fly) hypothetical protein n=1 Tax=Ceratitis capitata TaxID=7213 RepID=W8AYD3_CERCA|nr:unnamed protein product [Ceratitis capitata]
MLCIPEIKLMLMALRPIVARAHSSIACLVDAVLIAEVRRRGCSLASCLPLLGNYYAHIRPLKGLDVCRLYGVIKQLTVCSCNMYNTSCIYVCTYICQAIHIITDSTLTNK